MRDCIVKLLQCLKTFRNLNLDLTWLAALALCLATGGMELIARAAAPQAYDVWPVEEGWTPSTITSITQTQDGYIWLGTYHGLMRYDGVRFTVFDSSHTPGLQSSRITALFQDREGKLWIGHETGQLTQMADGAFYPANPGPAWPGGAIETIIPDANDDLWLVNSVGILFRLRDGLAVECPGGASASRKAALGREKGGRLWIVSNGRVATLEDGKVAEVHFPGSSASDFYERVAGAQDGGLWVLGNGRVRKWAGDHWDLNSGETPWEQGAVTGLLEMRTGALLVATLNSGLYMLHPGLEPLHFSRTNGLSHDWIRSLCEDHEGNIWIGTGAGLDTLRPRQVKMLDAPDHWQGRTVLSFIVQPHGAAWIGTEGAGLYRYTNANWTSYVESSGLSNLFVWSVLETRRGELYVGTWGGGLFVKNGDHFDSPGDLAKITAPVVSLYEGRGGEIWIGTTAGIYRYDAGKLAWFAGKEQLSLPDVRAIAQSPDGSVWFGMSGGGLACLKDGRLKQFKKDDGLNSDSVMSLYAEPNGTLWIGTSDNGLGRWKDAKFATVGAEQGLPSSTVSHIVDDEAGNLWLGSDRGILRISKASLNLCADGAARSVRCFSYGKAEGLASLNCPGGFQPGACKTAQGLLWFPTAKGVAIIDPMKVASNPVPPPVVIEDLVVDGRPVERRPHAAQAGPAGPGRALRIPPGQQRFEVRYTGLSFAAPDKVRFQYKLEGLEHEWMDAGTKRVIEYSYLPPGAYTFQVIACNNDEVWNQTGASLSFMVLPQFWQTWWFRALSVVTGAGAVAAVAMGVMRRRVRRKLEQLERQRALERERARIARDIHDELGASLTRITLLSQSVRSELPDQQPAAADVDQIYTNARELTRAMDEIVWAVNPKHDTFDSLVTYLGRFAQNFLSAAAIRCRLDVPLHLPAWVLTAETRHNLFLAFKEALHNVVKHARATEVRISLELRPDGFMLVVADNGRGFSWKPGEPVAAVSADGARAAGGNGLLNMQKRLEEIGGCCGWDTAPGEGTRAKLIVCVIKTHDNRFLRNEL